MSEVHGVSPNPCGASGCARPRVVAPARAVARFASALLSLAAACDGAGGDGAARRHAFAEAGVGAPAQDRGDLQRSDAGHDVSLPDAGPAGDGGDEAGAADGGALEADGGAADGGAPGPACLGV